MTTEQERIEPDPVEDDDQDEGEDEADDQDAVPTTEEEEPE